MMIKISALLSSIFHRPRPTGKMAVPGGNVPALVALIVNAAKTIEAEYAKSSKPSIPSLDDLSPHPLDTEISSSELREATRILEGACAQLCATAARPDHTIVNVRCFMDRIDPDNDDSLSRSALWR